MPVIGLDPFQPGRGILPPLVAGRERELEIAERLLGGLAEGRSPAPDLLFYGPRGNGKTTLLLEVRRRGEERGMRVENLSIDALTDPNRLVGMLRERSRRFGGVFTGGRTAGSGNSATPNAPSEDPGALLADWVGSEGQRPLVILLDEVHTMSPEVGRSFFAGARWAKSRAAPFSVLAAGLPEAPRRLREAGVSDGSGFRFLPVGRLARPDAVAALVEPARESGRPLIEDAATLLAEESQDYPYFVQLMGSAAWKAAGTDSAISLRAAREGVAELRDRIEEFFHFRYQEAEEHRIEQCLKPLALLFDALDGHLTESRFEAFLRRVTDGDEIAFAAPALREKLSDLGVVWSEHPGVWEMGIPGFADFLVRRG